MSKFRRIRIYLSAAQYTEKGSITVSCSPKEVTATGFLIELSVHDTG
jgi:hypothetical protein